MDFDAIVTGGRVFVRGAFERLDIGLREGTIAAVGQPAAFGQAEGVPTIDAASLLVFPGVIDSHVHARAPSHPEREDFASISRAAAAGGVTAVIEMPISEPPAINGAIVRDRVRLAEAEACVDVGFYASAATLQRADLVSSIDAGALAFKGFLQHVPAGRESEFAGLCLPTMGDAMEAFALLAEFGLPCVFHPEDESIYQRLESRLRAAGRRDGRAHAESRPDYVEAVSVGSLLRLAEHFGVHLHVPHVSSAMTVALIREAKARGAPVTAETCPHYLQFDDSALARLGPYAKCNPPFKQRKDIEALWDGVRDGTIDTLASDHSPFTIAEKDAAKDDIWLGPPGFPGTEVLAPFAIGAALDGRLSWPRLNALLFENPARVFDLWPARGAIQPGANADLLFFDPAPRGVFDHRALHNKVPASAVIWDGVPRHGSVVRTIRRGETIYADGAVVGAGGGRQLTREQIDQTGAIAGEAVHD
ncbi:MAG TPA: dihydroorotase family protein [Thermomicrobiales bacterium]|nr:dihydroorotase family protein [Thermomicrobiales bacterium]